MSANLGAEATRAAALLATEIRRVAGQAAEGHGVGSPLGAARAMAVLYGARMDDADDAATEQVGHVAIGFFQQLASTRSASGRDVAAKLAALIVAQDGVPSTPIELAERAVLASALADLVLLDSAPLPGAAVLANIAAVPRDSVDIHTDASGGAAAA